MHHVEYNILIMLQQYYYSYKHALIKMGRDEGISSFYKGQLITYQPNIVVNILMIVELP